MMLESVRLNSIQVSMGAPAKDGESCREVQNRVEQETHERLEHEVLRDLWIHLAYFDGRYPAIALFPSV